MNQEQDAFWSIPADKLLEQLGSKPEGLTSEDVRRRLAQHGSNILKPKKRSDVFTLLISQFKSPIILILLFAVGLSFFLHDTADAIIILVIVLISGLLGFWQERGAANAVEKLLAIVQIDTAALRDGKQQEIHIEEIVPGDIVILKAGDVCPGDCLLLEAKDLFIDEATLTGETYPVEKEAAVLGAETQLAQRVNSLWMGTHVISGGAKAVVVRTGRATEFGKVSERLKLRPQETEFEHGVRQFGYFLMEVTLMLVIAIFAINVYLHRPVLDAFLFSLALAVGLTPQLLPAIISINLAHGAKRMAQSKVIVKRLASIENFGSMNVLCSDKTGTLTEGVVRLKGALDLLGNDSERVLQLAYVNAFYETGFVNPIDNAIRTFRQFDMAKYRKRDEIPYDFIRKRLSVMVDEEGQSTCTVITKGALSNVLEVCSTAEAADGTKVAVASVKEQIQRLFEDFSGKGFRTLGIAYKISGKDEPCKETDMTFLGFLILFDPPKANIVETINRLSNLGVSLKVITGDNHLVAANVRQQMGLAEPKILTGAELRETSDSALLKKVMDIDVFAEVEPNQKERIIIALRKAGNVVGYMGDGINDASALHAADVGISVNSAADVAKEAADIVLLEQDLGVLVDGVTEGRRTFANTLKYVFMATSANFGNMFSMAGASLFMPFLPLLPKQILLTNLMTDFPEMSIATDAVDDEMVSKPRRWDIHFIRKFMLLFGFVSSVFDYVTFGVLIYVLHAGPGLFRTGWFVGSVVSASLIVLVIRTRKLFFRSRPGRSLLIATLIIVTAAVCFPFSPLAGMFGFQRLPLSFIAILAGIILMYVFTAELAKKMFYRYLKDDSR